MTMNHKFPILVKKIDDDLQINRITSQKFQIGMSGELEFSSPIFRLKMGILFDIAFVLLSNFLALVFHTKKHKWKFD